MTDDDAVDRSSASLGDAIESLSRSAGSLEADLGELQDAVDGLQLSTERCSEHQRTAATSLSKAAERLSAAERGPVAGSQGAGGAPTPADD